MSAKPHQNIAPILQMGIMKTDHTPKSKALVLDGALIKRIKKESAQHFHHNKR